MTHIKATKAFNDGIWFRSRNEARSWDYWKQRFAGQKGSYEAYAVRGALGTEYLFDFKFGEHNYVEIKHDQVSPEDCRRAWEQMHILPEVDPEANLYLARMENIKNCDGTWMAVQKDGYQCLTYKKCNRCRLQRFKQLEQQLAQRAAPKFCSSCFNEHTLDELCVKWCICGLFSFDIFCEVLIRTRAWGRGHTWDDLPNMVWEVGTADLVDYSVHELILWLAVEWHRRGKIVPNEFSYQVFCRHTCPAHTTLLKLAA